MSSVIPHTMLPSNSDDLSRLVKDGYNITHDSGLAIIHKEIGLPGNLGSEGLDAKIDELRKEFEFLNGIGSDFGPSGLVRTGARGRYTTEGDDKEPKARGYILEIREDGPRLYNLEHNPEIPILGGFGSLMDPIQLALNTESGDLRNTADPELREKIAEEKNVSEKMGYFSIEGMGLSFNRGPTASRYGNTQKERNQYAVLNSILDRNKTSYVVLFDPAKLTEDPLKYLAIENFDEMEYARLFVDGSKSNHIGGAKLDVSKGIWFLHSPRITDVDGRLQFMGSRNNSQINERYIGMLTNGLSGAGKVSPSFSTLYMTNTLLPNGQPLSTHDRFVNTLNSKMHK
jgi:hypothetical protein